MNRLFKTTLPFGIIVLLLVACGSDGSGVGSGTDTGNEVAKSSTESDSAQTAQCDAEVNDLGYYDPDNYLVAYICEIDTLSWPGSYRPNADHARYAMELNPHWEETLYPPGMPILNVTTEFGVCAWVLELRDAVDVRDEGRYDSAVEHLWMYAVYPVDNVPGFPPEGRHESTTDHWRGLLGQAELGDASGVLNRALPSCSLIEWPSTETGP